MKNNFTSDILIGSKLNHGAALERIYHKGQDNIWDGKETLDSLFDEYGVSNISSEKLNSLRNIFSVIFWGEYAAWNISSDLALRIDNFEAKMAATSQAHDEARHFYVMRDYLDRMGISPKPLTGKVSKTLNFVLNTNSLPKKLLGMQLMVEPIAITIFRLVIRSEIEPVLCNLLKLYEKDEARHIALGVKYLPTLVSNMKYYQVADLFFWQLRLMLLEVDGLRELKDDFEVLGFDMDDVYEMAERMQLDAARLMGSELGIKYPPWKVMSYVARAKKELVFSKKIW